MADEMTIDPCPFNCGANGAWPCEYMAGDQAVICTYCGARGSQMASKELAIAAWNAAGRWISVEDGLPKFIWKEGDGFKETDYVTTYDSKGEYGRMSYIVWTSGEAGWYHENTTRAKGVTHWRPLPPAPVDNP